MKKITTILLLICIAAFAQQKGTFTDTRDGKIYKTVKIGKQTWLAENLNYNANGSKCYENQESNCQKYGRLYDGNIAKTACPSGWHLPSQEEWNVLVAAVGGLSTAGRYLKTSDWGGENKYGFAALPGGYGNSDGNFYNVGYGGNWWSASENDAGDAYNQYMGYDIEYVPWFPNSKYGNLFSVRCVKD
jgi:uncharacterized protein (TIGR02145 family)